MSYPHISIIVPIYNVEAYLSECLDSVLAQSYPHWECICINDGSSDSSTALLDSYASRDPRIIAVHTDNAGTSAARNRGLNLMRGTYFTFLDGDDRYAPDALEHYLELALRHDADIVEASTALFSTDGEQHWSVWEQEWNIHKDRVFSQPELPTLLTIRPYVWNTLYHRRLWEQSSTYFDPQLCISEDYQYKLTLLARVTSPYVFSSKQIYHYRKGRADSAMSKTSPTLMASQERHCIESILQLWQHLGRLKQVQTELMDMIYHSLRNRHPQMSKTRILLELMQYSGLLARIFLTLPDRESWAQYKLRQRELLRLTRNHIRRPAALVQPARPVLTAQKSPRIARGFSKAYFALSLYDRRLAGLDLTRQHEAWHPWGPSNAKPPFPFPQKLPPPTAQVPSLIPAQTLITRLHRPLL